MRRRASGEVHVRRRRSIPLIRYNRYNHYNRRSIPLTVSRRGARVMPSVIRYNRYNHYNHYNHYKRTCNALHDPLLLRKDR